MKTITKIRLLNFFNIFNVTRDFFIYRREKKSKKVINFYSKFISPGDLCFDIGANIGRKSGILLELGAKVVAIEPQPSCMNFLRKKFKNNKDIVFEEKALAAKEGEGKMWICEANSLSSLSAAWINNVQKSGRYKDFKWDKEISVEVTTLDRLIEVYGMPKYCKIDVEGYEYEVLKGLSQPICYMSFETSPETLQISKNCIDYVSNLGNATFNFSSPEKYCFLFDNFIDKEQILKQLYDNIFGDIYIKFL
jgi:FkbM family methyltransferase